jgi:N-acetylmuramoyl-L-alanine amidase
MPIVSAEALFASLGGVLRRTGVWAEGAVPGQSFRFLVGTPYYRVADETFVLAGSVSIQHDTLFIPFQFLSEILPGRFSERYHYDGPRARFTEIGGASPVLQARQLPNGLLPGHLVTIDPGHGGNDPGTAGSYLPKGVSEKNITLQIGLMLRDELKQRGVGVLMTRTTDTRPPLLKRAPMCSSGCDMFVSLHVDAMPSSRRNYRSIRGFHTFIIGEENSADAARVARIENDALRYEVEDGVEATSSALDFIFKDLQMNEFLRESADAAALIQQYLAKVHGGENKGVHQYNRWAVLNTAQRPAVLVELGFRTNQQDAAFLTSKSGQRRIAGALADAIVEYLKDYDRKTGALSAAGAGR